MLIALQDCGVSNRELWVVVGKSRSSWWSSNCLRAMAAGKDRLVRGLRGARAVARAVTLAVGS